MQFDSILPLIDEIQSNEDKWYLVDSIAKLLECGDLFGYLWFRLIEKPIKDEAGDKANTTHDYHNPLKINRFNILCEAKNTMINIKKSWIEW